MLVGLRPEGQFWGWCGSGEELAGSAYRPAASPAPAASHFCRWLGRAPGPGKPALWRQSLLWELTLCTKGGPWGASGRFLCLPPEGGAWGAALCRPPAPALGGAGGRGCLPQPRTPSSSLLLLPRGQNWVSPGCGLGLHTGSLWGRGWGGAPCRAREPGLVEGSPRGGPGGPGVCVCVHACACVCVFGCGSSRHLSSPPWLVCHLLRCQWGRGGPQEAEVLYSYYTQYDQINSHLSSSTI